MSIWPLTYQQNVFKSGGKHFSEFYLQDGGKNQLTMEQLLRHCHPDVDSQTEQDIWCRFLDTDPNTDSIRKILNAYKN